MLTEQELQFLRMANNTEFRTTLLKRLEQLGLLSAFLEAESGTQMPQNEHVVWTTEKAECGLIFLAAKTGTKFSKTGDASEIVDYIIEYLHVAGLSKKQSSAVLRTALLKLQLKESVI